MSSVLSLPPHSSSGDLNKGGFVADPLSEGHIVPLVKGPGVVASGGEDDRQSFMRDVGLDADTCAGKFMLVSMGGRANGQACTDEERGPPSERAEIIR